MLQRWVLYTLSLQFLGLSQCSIASQLHAPPDFPPADFNWSSIEASHKLRYTPCYEGLECARLTVPLDWNDESNTNEVVIAVTRLPANVSEDDHSFGGTIVINPGGPGGSGVGFLLWAGTGIQEIVDGDKSFEVLSFDPRGTGQTTPSIPCFEDDVDRGMFALQTAQCGSVADSGFSLNTKWALSQGLGTLCDSSGMGSFSDGTNMRQFVTTALTARDMVALVDAVDEQRRHSLSQMKGSTHAQKVLNEERTLPLLNYWGYSYGSYLGNTFASMFPERIGRMILDGVVNAPDYAATGWTTNLNDNDKVWLKFFEWCYEAGSKCALNNKHVKGPNDIADQLEDFIENLIDNPRPIVYNDNIYLFTYFNFQGILHLTSYTPWQSWPLLATTIAVLYESDPNTPTPLSATQFQHLTHPPSLHLPIPSLHHPHVSLSPYQNDTISSPSYPSNLEATIAILCGDGTDVTFHSKSNYTSYISYLSQQSKLIGPIWAQITLWCRHWAPSQRPSDTNRFTGPFTSSLSQYAGNGKDGWARPLLFIANSADPVTPRGNALAMAAKHEGARVLVLDAPGHCSGVHVPSECSWGVVREYFNDGVMPKWGKVCGVDFRPWDVV